jgi:hypothetical protein
MSQRRGTAQDDFDVIDLIEGLCETRTLHQWMGVWFSRLPKGIRMTKLVSHICYFFFFFFFWLEPSTGKTRPHPPNHRETAQ